ncbi:hypothetical protein ACHAXT_003169 [Thalassiosira profunda]
MSFSYRADQDEEPGYTHNITGVAVSNSALLVVSTLGFGALGIALYFLVLRRLSQGGDDAQVDADRGRDACGEMLDQSDVGTLNRAQRRLRAKRRMKNARRVVVPGQHQQAEGVEGEQEVMGEEGDAREIANVEPALSRKERQRAAKAMEKEERKAYANEARLRREKTQSTLKSEGSSKDKKPEEPANKHRVLAVEELFPQRESDGDDALSEQLFWGTICRSIKQRSQSYDDTLSMVQRIPRMTVRAFIDSLKQNGSVSIAALAEEFGISISDALAELESINKRLGVVGVCVNGKFIYVSMEMIREAVKLGKEAGRIPSPMEVTE